jgi:hypothetical protein
MIEKIKIDFCVWLIMIIQKMPDDILVFEVRNALITEICYNNKKRAIVYNKKKIEQLTKMIKEAEDDIKEAEEYIKDKTTNTIRKDIRKAKDKLTSSSIIEPDYYNIYQEVKDDWKGVNDEYKQEPNYGDINRYIRMIIREKRLLSPSVSS